VKECEETRDALPQVLLGEAEPTLATAVHNHLTMCAACREEEEALRGLLGRLTTAEFPEPGETYWQEFLPRLRGRIARERLSTRASPSWMFSALAACAATLLLAAALVGSWQFPADGDRNSGLDPLVERADPDHLERTLENVFPELQASAPGGGSLEAVPAAEEMEEALEAVLPADDTDIFSTAQDLPPEARRWFVEVLGPGRV